MNKSVIAFLNVISTAVGEGIKQFNGIISTDELSLQDALNAVRNREDDRTSERNTVLICQ